MTELYVEAEIEGLGNIVRVEASFDESLASLRDKESNPISPRDLAYARMRVSKNHSLNKDGSYTASGFLYAKNANPLFALESPLLDSDLVGRAIKANRNGRYFSTENTELYEKYLATAEDDKSKNPEERRVLILPSKNFKISAKNNPQIFGGIFKDVADKYLEFTGFPDLDVYLVDEDIVNDQKGTLLTQLWLRWLAGRSGLDGEIWGLGYNYRIRGVSVSGEANAKNSSDSKRSELYTLENVRKALNTVGITTGVEKLVLDSLQRRNK